MNITDEHICKNPQQNTSKSNSTIHYMDHTPYSNGIYPKNARMIQYLQMNQCDKPHQQIEE